MEAPISTRAALLQALRRGPGFGRELIRRIERMTQGRLRLSQGRVYPILGEIEKQGLVTSSVVVPKGRRGARARRYYDLTLRGIEVSSEERATLRTLLEGDHPRPPSARARARMLERLLEVDDLALSAEQLAGAMARARQRKRTRP